MPEIFLRSVTGACLKPHNRWSYFFPSKAAAGLFVLLCCGYAIADASGSIVVGVIAAELVCMYGALIFFVRGEEKPDEKLGEDKPCEEQCFCLPGCALNKKRKKRKERKTRKEK